MQQNIIIVEKDIIISKNSEVTEKLNNFFVEAVESLEIDPFAPDFDNSINKMNVEEIIKKYVTYPSILKIKENVEAEYKFLFNEITTNNFKEELYKLDPKNGQHRKGYTN